MRRLRLQLIFVLILVALLPAIPAVWTANTLFRETLDPLLQTELVEGTQAGLESTRTLLKAQFAAFESRIFAGESVDTLSTAWINTLSEKERSSLIALEEMRVGAPRVQGGIRILQPPQRVTLHGREAMVARIQGETGSPQWVRAALPAELTGRAETITRALLRLETFRHERESIYRSLLATFSLVYGLILGLVLLLALYVASRLTRPLAALGQGIERVSAGNLEARVPLAGGGEMRGLLEGFNDMVSKLRDQQDELRRLEKVTAWRRMAKSLAHEIKNPLTPIQLAAQQLRDSFGDTVTAGTQLDTYKALLQESTQIIEEEVGALRNLVTEFSQFARLPEPHMERVAVPAILRDLVQLYGSDRVRLLESEFEGEGEHHSGDGPHVWGDRGQLHRAILNLVTNALDAQGSSSGPSGAEPVELTCRTRSSERLIDIGVRDHGPGIPDADTQRIFEPDYTTKSDGMGLGLAIVEATVSHHHGTVAVTTHQEGGAVFTVTLPAAVEGGESS